jgi:hypothetical protein
VTDTRTPPPATTEFDDTVQSSFVEHLSRITQHAKYALRHVGCRDTRDDLIAEVQALAWKYFVRLARGKKPEKFICTLALRCSQAVRAGRRVAGGDRTRDGLSPIAMARHGFAVVRLEEYVPAPRSEWPCGRRRGRRSAGRGPAGAF